ncbi:hypothetical protein LguiB_020221 [Lonicera macranthoides]
MKEIRIHPNVYTYRIMIVALCRCGQIKSAHDVFVEMIDVGIESNSITFNNLMHVHVKAGLSEKSHFRDENREEAIKVLNSMVKKSCTPNAYSFNPIFRCILTSRDVNAAHKLFARMKELNMDGSEVELNVNSYRILISLYCGVGHWNNAYKFFREMVEEKCLKSS